jgi:glycosyltransferase involved in cell wall biosynthesis
MGRTVPSVTAVVPTRNRVGMLARTLACVLAQRDVDLEVVVVDEGSTDATPDLLAALGDRVHVVRHDEPKGLPAARNAGLAVAHGKWVGFCDDDDLWAPDKLAAQVDAAVAVGASWSATGSVNVDVDDRVIGAHRPTGGEVHRRLRAGNIVPGGGSGVVAERSLLEQVGGFDEKLRASEDYDCWIRLAAESPLAAVDRPLLGYRVWPGTMSTDVRRQRSNHAVVAARHVGDDLDPDEVREADLRFRQYLARRHLGAGRRWDGFRDYLAIAAVHRQPSHVAHAVGALTAPRLTDRYRARHERAQVPAAYLAEATTWLRAVEALEVPGR